MCYVTYTHDQDAEDQKIPGLKPLEHLLVNPGLEILGTLTEAFKIYRIFVAMLSFTF